MTKKQNCHIEPSRNVIKTRVTNVFDLLRKLLSVKIYFDLVNAQTDIQFTINFCPILIK